MLFLFPSSSRFFLKAHLGIDYLPVFSPAYLQLTYSYLWCAFKAFCPDCFYNFMYSDSSKFKTLCFISFFYLHGFWNHHLMSDVKILQLYFWLLNFKSVPIKRLKVSNLLQSYIRLLEVLLFVRLHLSLNFFTSSKVIFSSILACMLLKKW